jgi:glycerol uptake facilitator-like aquaporin
MASLTIITEESSRDTHRRTTASSILHKWLIKPRPMLISKFFIELCACMIFHFVGSISATPWANGIILMVLVYYTAKITGAHLNPALSLTFTMLGHTNPLEMLVYWAAQVLGCMLGALWLAILVPGLRIGASGSEQYSGCFYPAHGTSAIQVFGLEAICTFNFIVPIFSVVWYTIHKKGYGNTGPLMVGLSLIANAFAAGPFTGGSLNPARSLGSVVVFDCDNRYLKNYILGQLLGGALVPLFVMPWYGISPKAWYLDFVPVPVVEYMRELQPSIVISPAIMQAAAILSSSMQHHDTCNSIDVCIEPSIRQSIDPAMRRSIDPAIYRCINDGSIHHTDTQPSAKRWGRSYIELQRGVLDTQ